jgi:hypothetical protein
MPYGTVKVDQITTSTQTVDVDGLASKASPALTGTPTAPTAAVNSNTTQIATTAFVLGQAGNNTPAVNGTAAVGTATRFSREDHVHASDTTKANVASPTFTGTPAAPTAAADTNTTQLATTAFVVGQASSSAPVMDGVAAVGTSVKYARADHVHASDTSKANLASPTLTGIPAAPTAAADSNTTQIATTAFVLGQAANSTPVTNGTAAVGTSLKYARADHVHAIDTSRAPADSPVFTSSVTLSAQAPIRFADSNSSNWVAFRAPADISANVTWTLPASDGSANQVLRTDGSANLSWMTIAAGASIGVALALG